MKWILPLWFAGVAAACGGEPSAPTSTPATVAGTSAESRSEATSDVPGPATSRPARGASKTHALWATRWDYKTEGDVRAIVANAANAGFDTLYFQVRGNANAFYRSSFEPWAEELGGADPGYDPLAVAIEAAHAHGLALHAWVNVIPAWWGAEPPRDPAHVYHQHPEWMWYDQNGTRQPLQPRFYVSLNPCLPEVRYYIVSVMADLLARYAVDGLHMDYIRFPSEPPVIPSGSGIDYPRDARTVARFETEAGKSPDADKDAWTRWRNAELTKLARAIRVMQREVRPAAVLSAAVGSDPDHHYAHYFQDVRTWAAEGLVDVYVPMNYTKDNALYESRLDKWLGVGGAHRLVMGLQIHDLEPALDRRRFELALERCDGYSLFAYLTLFDSASSDPDAASAAGIAKRTARREQWLPILREYAGVNASQTSR
jgi:uncharacterized lipoprotein YddW (UPF0748 family)